MIESVALVRSRLGVPAVNALVDELLPALRVEMADRVTLAFAARHGIGRAFAFDADLVAAGLVPVAVTVPS